MGQGDETCAGTPPPWVWIILYLTFNVSFNLALTWLTKRMSAAWAQIATVLCLNLCSFFSQFKFLMGGGATPMTLTGLAPFLHPLHCGCTIWNLKPPSMASMHSKLLGVL